MTYNELCEAILTAQEQMLKHSIEANSVTLNGRKYGKLIENLPPNMKPTIFGMTVKADYAMPDDYEFLVQYEPPHPQTNADCFRAMTDEELASFLEMIPYCGSPPTYTADGFCIDDGMRTKNQWLDWLREEVKE